jgi:hypothetical protein
MSDAAYQIFQDGTYKVPITRLVNFMQEADCFCLTLQPGIAQLKSLPREKRKGADFPSNLRRSEQTEDKSTAH